MKIVAVPYSKVKSSYQSHIIDLELTIKANKNLKLDLDFLTKSQASYYIGCSYKVKFR